jgi:hypothetical protein
VLVQTSSDLSRGGIVAIEISATTSVIVALALLWWFMRRRRRRERRGHNKTQQGQYSPVAGPDSEKDGIEIDMLRQELPLNENRDMSVEYFLRVAEFNADAW